MKKVILLTVFAFLFSLGFSFAEVPCKINYQGRLIKDNVPVNGTVNMEFKLYDQLTGGTLKKAIPPMSVTVYNGLFRAVLDLTGIDWTAGQTIYLEVKAGTDILSPREEIYAYPYAINTRFLEGKAKDYFIDTSAGTQRKDGGLNIMGNVGIGTTSPGAKLHIGGTPGVDGIMFPDGTLQKTAGGKFPPPDYDSGWVPLNKGEAKFLTHNLGGNINNYVVDFQYRDSNGPNHYYYGIDADVPGYGEWGAAWSRLTTTQIRVFRGREDPCAPEVRVRIWVHQ